MRLHSRIRARARAFRAAVCVLIRVDRDEDGTIAITIVALTRTRDGFTRDVVEMCAREAAPGTRLLDLCMSMPIACAMAGVGGI